LSGVNSVPLLLVSEPSRPCSGESWGRSMPSASSGVTTGPSSGTESRRPPRGSLALSGNLGLGCIAGSVRPGSAQVSGGLRCKESRVVLSLRIAPVPCASPRPPSASFKTIRSPRGQSITTEAAKGHATSVAGLEADPQLGPGQPALRTERQQVPLAALRLRGMVFEDGSEGVQEDWHGGSRRTKK
jgi:hypothetical protein